MHLYHWWYREGIGAPREIRTPDLSLRRRVLCPLSHRRVAQSRALGGTRTPNLLIRSQMLYPLSYERITTHVTTIHHAGCGVNGGAIFRRLPSPAPGRVQDILH
jgi:hypothetical protein